MEVQARFPVARTSESDGDQDYAAVGPKSEGAGVGFWPQVRSAKNGAQQCGGTVVMRSANCRRRWLVGLRRALHRVGSALGPPQRYEGDENGDNNSAHNKAVDSPRH